ncbi:pilin, partial [Candidatus Saccharibacteria bacterium]|nr:pilin [Candidatus Saccharibacteria bacterium]
MIKYLTKPLTCIVAILLFSTIFATTASAFDPCLNIDAADPMYTLCRETNPLPGSGDEYTNPDSPTVQNYIQPILNMFYFVIGFLAVFFIVFGGVKYIMSSGDPGKIATAKNTILYAVIGLIVSLSAFAITQFVFDRITDSSASAPAD